VSDGCAGNVPSCHVVEPSTPECLTHTQPFNGPLSGTTRVSRYQKGETNLDFTEARDSEWQWHQLGHVQVYTSLQTDNHSSTPPLSFFTDRMPFLPPSQSTYIKDLNLHRQSAQTQDTHDTHYKPSCGRHFDMSLTLAGILDQNMST